MTEREMAELGEEVRGEIGHEALWRAELKLRLEFERLYELEAARHRGLELEVVKYRALWEGESRLRRELEEEMYGPGKVHEGGVVEIGRGERIEDVTVRVLARPLDPWPGGGPIRAGLTVPLYLRGGRLHYGPPEKA
jgi:GAF domain-containing protein